METKVAAPAAEQQFIDVERSTVPATIQPEPQQQARRAQLVAPPLQESSPASSNRAVLAMSPTIGSLFGALAKAQGEFKSVERSREARIESAKAKYTFEYETLADVIEATKDALSANGLSVLQFPFPGTSTIMIRTLLGHSSGEWISNDLSASLDGTDPRSIGSGITYLCRYARKAILGIAAEYDDDAEAATRIDDAPQASTRRSASRAAEEPQQPRPLPTPPAASEPAKSAPAAAAAQAPAEADPTKGEVQDVTEAQGQADVWFVRLASGYFAATRKKELADLARALVGTGKLVELIATKTGNYAPTLKEIKVIA